MCGWLGEAGLATDGLVRAQSSNSRLQPALACYCDNRDSRRYGHTGATAWHPIGLVTAYCIFARIGIPSSTCAARVWRGSKGGLEVTGNG